MFFDFADKVIFNITFFQFFASFLGWNIWNIARVYTRKQAV